MIGPLVDLAGTRMGRRLTSPLARGADVHELVLRDAAGEPPAAEVDAAELRAYLADHFARFDRPARPSYVLRALRDLDRAATVTVVLDAPGDPIELELPAGTLAGQSFALAVPADAAPRRLTAVPPLPGAAAAAWSLTALLGTTAKLLWALGWERDNVRRHAARTAEQRRLGSAIRASLDLIGTDLGVPRFPPLPYGFDQDTIALYHADDAPGADPAVADFTAGFPDRSAHHGTLVGAATPGVPGRFGTAIAMPDATSAVRVAASTDFAVPAGRDLTVECFVRPAAAATAAGQVLRCGTDTGWSIELGDFGRGLPRTVRARIADGTAELEAFGDVTLPVDGFTHVAAVLTRGADGAATFALWLDGRRAATAQAATFGPLAGAHPLVIGPDGTGFRGVIDEIRISAVARSDFFPVLGEADEHYRRRLGLFRRWVLPTPARLQELLNELIGPIGGLADPLVLDDGDGELVRGTTLLRVVPAAIPAGESMDAAGRRGVSEAELYDPDADATVDPALLGRHDRAGVVYTAPPPRDLLPGEPPADPHRVQPAVSAALDELAALTAQAAAGPLTVDLAFDPRVPGPHATGRAVLVRHLGFDPARLAALAHRAGFDFVRHLPLGGAVYCSCAPGHLVSLAVTPPPSGSDLVVGQPAAVRIVPEPPADTEITFRTIPLGPGRATITGGPVGGATLLGDVPGRAAIVADLTRGGRTVSAETRVTIRPATVAAGESIAADGTLAVTEDVVGPPEPTFDPALLVRVQDPRISFGDAADNRRMQRGVARRLTALLDRLGIDTAGALTVSSAFVPATGKPTLAARGRALTIEHAMVEPGALAAAAHAVGFGFVARSGQNVLLRHGPEQLIAVTGPAELEEGATAAFRVEPDPATLGPTVRLGWSSGGLVEGSVGVTTTTQPTASLRGQRSGRVWLQATLHDVDALTTYQVEVRLRPELVAEGAVVSRDQYDLIMNVLHALHPIGVEVITRRLREAVVELRGAAIDADPRYTYPQFRLHHERR